MSPEVAHLIAVESFRASSTLGNLVPIIKEHLPEKEYKHLSKAIAHCVSEIGVEVLNKVFSEHPLLREEFDRRVQTFGRAF